MKSKLVWEGAGGRTFVLALDVGEEASRAITDFAASNEIEAASLTATGGFERAELGWYDLKRGTYKPVPIWQPSEGLSLVGDVATDEDGAPSLRLHAVLGFSDGSTRGGHLLKGVVRPALEVTLVETLARQRDAAACAPDIDYAPSARSSAWINGPAE
jgi:uncharacterized protein